MKLVNAHNNLPIIGKTLTVAERMATTRDLWFDAKDANAPLKGITPAQVLAMLPTAARSGIAVFVKQGKEFYRVRAE